MRAARERCNTGLGLTAQAVICSQYVSRLVRRSHYRSCSSRGERLDQITCAAEMQSPALRDSTVLVSPLHSGSIHTRGHSGKMAVQMQLH